MECAYVNLSLHLNHQNNAKNWKEKLVHMEWMKCVEKMEFAYLTLGKIILLHALNMKFLMFW